MPIINISVEKREPKKVLRSMLDGIMENVQKCLNLQKDDRNIRILAYKKGFFYTQPPYKIIIEVSMFSGRSIELKKELYKTIISSITSNTSFKKENILILLNEQPRENWALNGGTPASEIDFSFY